MAEVRTDDAAVGLPYVWYGWTKVPLGFGVRFPTVGVFLAATFLGWFGVLVIVPGILAKALAGILVVPVAGYIARLIMRNIDADRPLAYYIEILRCEFHTPRPPIFPRRKHSR